MKKVLNSKEKIMAEMEGMIQDEISFIANVKKNMPKKHWYKRRFIKELEASLEVSIKIKNKIERIDGGKL